MEFRNDIACKMPAFADLDLKQDEDGIWAVTLNRPSNRIAIEEATIEELIEQFSKALRQGAPSFLRWPDTDNEAPATGK